MNVPNLMYAIRNVHTDACGSKRFDDAYRVECGFGGVAAARCVRLWLNIIIVVVTAYINYIYGYVGCGLLSLFGVI